MGDTPRGRGRPRKAAHEKYVSWHITVPPGLNAALRTLQRTSEKDGPLIARLIAERMPHMTTDDLLAAWREYEDAVRIFHANRPFDFTRALDMPRPATVAEHAGQRVAAHGTAGAALVRLREELAAEGGGGALARDVAVVLAQAAIQEGRDAQ